MYGIKCEVTLKEDYLKNRDIHTLNVKITAYDNIFSNLECT